MKERGGLAGFPGPGWEVRRLRTDMKPHAGAED